MSTLTITRPSARETPFGDLALTTPFMQAFVDDLKTEIPARARRWDAEERVWYVDPPYHAAAIDVLLAHFPRATVPGDHVRLVTREDPPPAPPPIPPVIVPPPPATDQPPLAALVAIVPCPRCGTRYSQPVRVVAQTSHAIAKAEQPPAELVTVCPSCNAMAVCSFFPAVAESVA